MVRASAVTTGGTSIRVPMTVERAASRARSSWRATWSRMMSVCSRTFVRERIVAAGCRLVDHDRERRFERMREIADMGARALDDFAVGVDQRVGLARQRRDLDREFAFSRSARPERMAARLSEMRLSGASPKRTCNAVVKQQRHGERRKGHADGAIETVGLVVDLRGVAGDRDQIAAVVAEIDIALDEAQLLVLGPLRIALRDIRRRCLRDRSGESRQAAVPQRARGMHFRRLGYRAA